MNLVATVSGLAIFFPICIFCCYRIIPILQALKIEDVSNERSSHVGSVPRAGGLGFIPPLLAGIFIVQWVAGSGSFWWISFGVTIGYALLSLLDDIYNLGTLFRLVIHGVLAAVFAFSILPEFVPQFLFLNETMARIVLTVLIVWWVNLYNFMDGIDGITIVQTATITLGVALLFMFSQASDNPAAFLIALLTLLSCVAFAFVNWHPARAFMGDVGSVALGAITGSLLIYLQRYHFSPAVLLLPMFYLVDGTSTLVWRAVTFQPFWKAHRSHAYQVFVAKGYSHSTACLVLAALNGFLVILALNILPLTEYQALGFGIAATSGVVAFFRTARMRGSTAR